MEGVHTNQTDKGSNVPMDLWAKKVGGVKEEVRVVEQRVCPALELQVERPSSGVNTCL